MERDVQHRSFRTSSRTNAVLAAGKGCRIAQDDQLFLVEEVTGPHVEPLPRVGSRYRFSVQNQSMLFRVIIVNQNYECFWGFVVPVMLVQTGQHPLPEDPRSMVAQRKLRKMNASRLQNVSLYFAPAGNRRLTCFSNSTPLLEIARRLLQTVAEKPPNNRAISCWANHTLPSASWASIFRLPMGSSVILIYSQFSMFHNFC